MSLDSMHWGLYKAGPAIDDSNAFRVLLRLADEPDPAGRTAFPSAQTIAADSASCVRTVYRRTYTMGPPTRKTGLWRVSIHITPITREEPS